MSAFARSAEALGLRPDPGPRWVEHWLFSRRYDFRDGWTTFLNLLLLFLLLFYAYPLKFLFTLLSVSLFGPIGEMTRDSLLVGFTGPDEVVQLFVFYGAGYGAIFAVLALLYVRALAFADDLALDPVERFLTRSAIHQALIQAAIAGLSVTLAVLGVGLRVGLPGWLYCLIGPAMALHARREARVVAALRSQ